LEFSSFLSPNRFPKMSTPYLGSKISLISRLDIRYEGILYTVDSNESTIALAKVRSFGTENRSTDHPVRARDQVYEYIIFKASDIKDLVVCEGPKQPEPGDVDYDPAIVSVSKPPARSEPPKSQPQLPTEPTRESPSPPQKPKTQAAKTQYQSSTSNQQPPPYYQKQQAWQRPDNRFQQPQGGQQQPRQPYNNRPFNPNQQQQSGYNNQRQNQNPRSFNRTTAPKEKLKFDNDYDFEKANEQFKEKLDVVVDEFDKVGLTDEIEESNSTDENDDEKDLAETCYDKKSSFFDTISCEALEKAEGRTNRPDWRKERQTNNETFGSSNVRSHAYHNYRNRFNPGGFRGNRQQQGGENRYPQQRPQNLNAFNPQGANRGPPRYQNNRDQLNQPQNRDNARPQRAYF